VGFTLIEVMAALVISSLGVLMVLNLTGAVSTQMNRAGLWSQVAVTLRNRLDSLQLVPYDSLTTETVSDTLTLNDRVFDRTHRFLQDSAFGAVMASRANRDSLTFDLTVSVPLGNA